MDFVATMREVFTAIVEFVSDAPRLPVARYPRGTPRPASFRQ